MKQKFTNALSLALIVAMLFTSVALADQVVNTIDNTIDPDLESATIVEGGETVVGFFIKNINNRGGDSVNSCNVAQGASATVQFNLPDGVTADPPSLLFTACDVTQYVTFSSDTPDSYTISIQSVTGGLTGSAWDTAPAAFELEVEEAPVTNTAPTVTVTGVTNGASYEFGSVPAATCDVEDAEDGNTSFAATLSEVSGPLSAYGLGSQTASCSYTDAGGLNDTDSATYSIVDSTAPDVSCGAADGLWHATDVSIPCTASDNVALANSADASFSLVTNVPGDTEDANASTDSRIVYDIAGNSAVAGPISGNMIDKKAPTNIAFVGGGITNGSSYYFGFVPAGPAGCTADDGGSGLASCNVTGGGTSVGSHSYVATATDNVGNDDTASLSYTVLAWTLSGFYAPVDMGGVYNTVKGGSTVPLKFEVFAGSTELTSTSVVGSFVQTRIACDGTAPVDDLEFVTTGGTSLRYDATAGQFVQNWQTPKLPGQCYRVTMTTDDGSSLVAFFKLK